MSFRACVDGGLVDPVASARVSPAASGSAGPPAVSGLAGSPRPGGVPGSETLGRVRRGGGGVRRGVGRRASSPSSGAQGRADDAAEGPLGTAPVEDGDLELGGGEAASGRRWSAPAVTGLTADSAADADLERVGQAHAGVEVLAQVAGDRLGLAAHDDEVGLVDDRAVEGEPVELVVLGAVADLGDAELDLEGLRLLGEDLAEGLGVGVGDDPAGDVAAVVGVAADVGQADAGDAQALELAVAADGGEADAVVELADLVQGGAGVLGDEQDAVGVGEDGDAAAAGDALAGVLRAVAHELLGRGVVRHGHGSALPRPCSGGRPRPAR